MTSVLVVDDDPLICKGLKFNLEQAGYTVVTATNGQAATELAKRHPFDVAILDIGLPGEDGLVLCQQFKAHYNMAIIFLTARRRELDEIVGLEVGADDYITKPFSMDVLMAHLKAVLRRRESRGSTEPQGEIVLGAFALDPRAHRVVHNGKPLALAPREFDLLYFLLANPDQVYTANEIVEHVWGPEFIGEPQVLYVQIRTLREKIEVDPSNPGHIITLRGVGYKFIP
jgi:DNA-binding response OmpR family regulator